MGTIWAYPFDENGRPLDRIGLYGGFNRFARWVVLKRQKQWLVFDTQGCGLVVNQAVFTMWLNGQDGLPFPTLSAARAFLALRSNV